MTELKYKNSKNKNIAYISYFDNYLNIESFAESAPELFKFSKVVKDDNKIRAGILHYKGTNYFIKHYYNRGYFYTLKNLFREPKPFKVIKISNLLADKNILAPRSYLAWIENKNLIKNDMYLVSDYVDNCLESKKFENFLFADRENIINFTTKIIKIIGEMHKSHVFHGDCKWSNFFVNNFTGHSYKVGIYDFDSAEIITDLNLENCTKDLGRFLAALVEVLINRGIEIKKGNLLNIFEEAYFAATNIKLDVTLLNKSCDKHLNRKNLI